MSNKKVAGSSLTSATDIHEVTTSQITNKADARAMDVKDHDSIAELSEANDSLNDIETAVESLDAKTNNDFGATSGAIRTASIPGNVNGIADFNEGATGAQTPRVTANQGLPNTIANAWTVKVTDGTDNVIFTPVKDELHFNASQFGAPVFGLDRSTPNRKWRPIQVDTNGSISAHSVRADGNEITYGDGATDTGTQRTSANIKLEGSSPDTNAGAPSSLTLRFVGALTNKLGAYYEFLGTALSRMLPIQIVGGDGLYSATVDSLNRLAVNANIQFPEAVYDQPNLLNAGSKAMNVNGAGAAVTFQYTPPTGTTQYVEQISLFIADNANFTTGGFGALAALTNGLIIEYQSKGTLYTLANLQTNPDLVTTFSDHNFGASVTALLATDAYLNMSTRFQQRIALDQAFGDFIRARVRDNLTGLTTLNMRVKVWRVN